MADELFQLSNGRYITSEDISRKMFYIKKCHPELPYQEDSTGYSWDEAGMADLFSECYQKDTRYCPEAKSWYTYDSGKWHKDVGSLLVAAKIKEFVRLMALYCGEITDEDKRKQYMAFVGKMGDRRYYTQADVEDYFRSTDKSHDARWICLDDGKVKCSCCGAVRDYDDNYCGACGARMVWGKDEKENLRQKGNDLNDPK